MNRLEAQNLHRIFAGGLWTDDTSEGLGVEHAALRVAAAQLRAIRFALATNNDTEMPGNDDGRQSWDFGDSFSKDDAIVAIGGVVALLDGIHHAAGDITHALEIENAERDLETLKQAAAQKGGAT